MSHGIFLRFFLMHSVLAGEFGPSQAERLWQIGSVNCGLCTFEHGESVLETGYAVEPWRLVTWMARPWDPA